MMRLAHVVPVIALLALVPAEARTLAGVELPDSVTVDGDTLRLNGMGLRAATPLRIKAYVGALYLAKPTSDPTQVIESSQTKRVVMEFLRDVDRRQLTAGWAESLRKVGGTDTEIARFTALVPDVKKDDTMSFTWRPGGGLEVAANGRVRGSVPGDGFARALFTVWFGPEPGDAELKRGMLGK